MQEAVIENGMEFDAAVTPVPTNEKTPVA